MGKDYKIKNEDSLETKAIELPKIKDFLNIEIEKTKVFLNGKEILLNKEEFNVMFDGRVINIEEEIMNGANYTIKKVQKDLQLIDIFNHLSLNMNEIKSYEIYINGEKVESFLQKINPGADVKVLIND